jgi:hypothetical protein
MKTILMTLSISFLALTALTQNNSDTIYAGIVSDGMIYNDNNIVEFCNWGGSNRDLNGDGIDDFKFVLTCWESMNTQGAIAKIDMLGNFCCLNPLDSGTVITQYTCGSNLGDLAYDYHYAGGQQQTGGPWLSVPVKYMAMEINNTEIPFLAWIKMEVNLSMMESEIIIYEYAWQDFTSGYNDNSENVGIYPVPVNNLLTFSFRNNEECNYDIRIFNSMGIELLRSKVDETDNQINFGDFMPGVYYIKLIPPKGHSFTKKIIKIKD